jgi:threonine/homoserine/homoserine lactone efflux protein
VSALLGFLAVATLIIVTPGQDTALTIRNTLVGGRSAGIGTAAGVAGGQLTWAVATSIGIASLLRTSTIAYEILRFAGIAYLVYLGALALRAAVRGSANGKATGATGPAAATPARSFRQGILSNLSNPKMAAFFPSLLPQFVPPDDFAAHALALGTLFAAMTLSWLVGYAFVVSRAGDFLRRPRVRRAIEATTGGVLIALGAHLALESR